MKPHTALSTDDRRCAESTDDRFNIMWRFTPAGLRDAKAYSLTTSRQGVEGFAYRTCQQNGSWEGAVDISECQTMRINQLRDMAVSKNSTEHRVA